MVNLRLYDLFRGSWHGRTRSGEIRLDTSGRQQNLPLGDIHTVETAYIYLNADAKLLVNGQILDMRCTRDGFWEYLACARISSLAVWTDHISAQGKYSVYGHN